MKQLNAVTWPLEIMHDGMERAERERRGARRRAATRRGSRQRRRDPADGGAGALLDTRALAPDPLKPHRPVRGLFVDDDVRRRTQPEHVARAHQARVLAGRTA